VTYKSLAHENTVDVLRLIRTQNVGPITFFQLMRRFGSAAEAIEALPTLSLRGGQQRGLGTRPQRGSGAAPLSRGPGAAAPGQGAVGPKALPRALRQRPPRSACPGDAVGQAQPTGGGRPSEAGKADTP